MTALISCPCGYTHLVTSSSVNSQWFQLPISADSSVKARLQIASSSHRRREMPKEMCIEKRPKGKKTAFSLSGTDVTDDSAPTLFLMTSQLPIQTYHRSLQGSLRTSFRIADRDLQLVLGKLLMIYRFRICSIFT
jgi:hypothetical protein